LEGDGGGPCSRKQAHYPCLGKEYVEMHKNWQGIVTECLLRNKIKGGLIVEYYSEWKLSFRFGWCGSMISLLVRQWKFKISSRKETIKNAVVSHKTLMKLILNNSGLKLWVASWRDGCGTVRNICGSRCVPGPWWFRWIIIHPTDIMRAIINHPY